MTLSIADLNHDSITHRDGIPWYEAPRPRRFRHRHSAQTTSNIIDRCACGALRYRDDMHWIEERTGLSRFR